MRRNPVPVDDPSRAQRLQALGELSAGLAHELRNSLQVASTHGFLLRRDHTSVAAHLPKIEQHLARSQRIVTDILLLAGPAVTLSKQELTPIVELAEAGTLDVAPLLWGRTLQFERDLGDPAVVVSHAGLLERILAILYDNAARAGANTVCTVFRLAEVLDPASPGSLVAGRAHTQLLVLDDGPGVPQELHDTLFDSGVSGYGSLGLGLALAARMAEALGLELSFYGNGQDARFVGAAFAISWPLTPNSS